MERNPERFGLFLSGQAETNRLKSEITRRLRLHRIAEAYLTMHQAGAIIFRDEKPDVFYPDGEECRDITMSSPAFYGSREIKELGADAVKISGARPVGALLAPSCVYAVYNTGNALMRWNSVSEVRTRALLKSVVCIERLHRYYRPDDVRALMLGDSMETMYRLMTSKGGPKKRFFHLDGNHDNFYYVTNDDKGAVLLRLLCDPEKTAELCEMLSEDLYERQPGLPVENDAIDADGNPVLFGYDCDMPRIARFSGGVSLHGVQGTLICFDYQAETLRRCCDSNIQIQEINFGKFKKLYFPELNEKV